MNSYEKTVAKIVSALNQATYIADQKDLGASGAIKQAARTLAMEFGIERDLIDSQLEVWNAKPKRTWDDLSQNEKKDFKKLVGIKDTPTGFILSSDY